MKLLSKIREAVGRCHVLLARRVVLPNLVTGEDELLDELDWAIVWALAGPRASSWWWIRRWGRLDCGCLRIPGTGRLVLITGDCTQHSPWASL